jgi:DNA-binding transcriptional MerR regulator
VTSWTTREAAEKCGLSQHTVRWYERIGLLARVGRTADGRRQFTDADLDWLLLLSRLRATKIGTYRARVAAAS